ncbi:MAG: 3'-5' exonuclease domain-containing protein 2 [Verrucomicrobia bacterium]|nr:3'-5' exonuclease domain-containing protein 2 [Verrucomicrobiota bacterium]
MTTDVDRPGFTRRMTKEEINELPVRKYTGKAHVISSEKDVSSAISVLSEEKILGFDTETKPVFKKGVVHMPALIQLATAREVFIFQLRKTGFPPKLRGVLANADIVKAGVAAGRDVVELQQLEHFEGRGFIDISKLSEAAGIQNHGLRGLSAVLLSFRISKRAQLSNWESEELTQAQIDYAATDAWVSRELYMRLLRLQRQAQA